MTTATLTRPRTSAAPKVRPPQIVPLTAAEHALINAKLTTHIDLLDQRHGALMEIITDGNAPNWSVVLIVGCHISKDGNYVVGAVAMATKAGGKVYKTAPADVSVSRLLARGGTATIGGVPTGRIVAIKVNGLQVV